jgi:hypothetical protein
MSEGYGVPAPRDTAATGQSGSVETAKQEAGALKDTAVSEAGHVAETAKGEAKAVAQEVKYQAKDLYAQTQRELKDQAQVQQHRAAAGLRSVSDELQSLTANAQNPGLAVDLLNQVSTRLSGAASWLGDRDPSAVLSEVKSFARRKPGTFIIGAAILGIVAGRLTRALAANASDEHADQAAGPGVAASNGRAGLPTSSAQLYATPPTVEETPVFAQSSAGRGVQPARDVSDVRSDSF